MCLLKCPCGLVYVGQTKGALKTCISDHKKDVHNAQHYVNANHSSAASLKFWGMEKKKKKKKKN